MDEISWFWYQNPNQNSLFWVFINETEFHNSALITSTSSVKICPSRVQISFAPSCCILWSSYWVVHAAMAKDPPASATTLLEAQLIVTKAAASKKQQKNDKAKVSKKSKTASKRKQDKENQDAEPKAEKGIYTFCEYSSKSHTFSNTRVQLDQPRALAPLRHTPQHYWR